MILFVFPLTGCFEFIHEMDVNADGTGHLNFVVNFSRSKSKIEMLLLLDEINGHEIPTLDEVDLKLRTFSDSANASKGISNVNHSFDKQSLIIEFSCDFDKVSRINQRLYELWKQKEVDNAVYENYYSFKANHFEQNLSYRVVKLFQQMSPTDREILIGADYTSILRFKNEIISQSNSAAKIAPNKKVIILQAPVLELIHKPNLFNNSIKIKS
ncbi:hypothetical protein N8987_00590 [Crocinitomix sp.]|nr:hypothetical protein [Crocinitomix sp.]